MTPSHPWLGITTPSWLKESGTPQQAAGGRPPAGWPGTPRGQGRRAGAPGQGGHSGRIGTCMAGRDRAPGSW